MTKAIAVTQRGNETIFMIGDYQATLEHDFVHREWTAKYFKKSQALGTSRYGDHPRLKGKADSRGWAESIIKEILGNLNSGKEFMKAVLVVAPPQDPKPKRSKPQIKTTRSRGKTPKVVTAYQVIDRLLNLVDDTCTVLVPMGKPAALKLTKVRIVDSEGETICEIPYSIFQGLLFR